MKRLKSVLLLGVLGILAISLFASTWPVSLAKHPQWFYWDVYLWFPEPGPPQPYMMDSNLWWANSVVPPSEDLYVREVMAGNKWYFFFRGVKDFVDLDGDEVVDGTLVTEMIIVWDLSTFTSSPGDVSVRGRFNFHRGTGSLHGMVAHGSAGVQYFDWDDTALPYHPTGPGFNGLVMVQRQAGYIVNSP